MRAEPPLDLPVCCVGTRVTGASRFAAESMVGFITGTIPAMKKLLAAVLLLTAFASPVFAAKKPHKQPHPKYDYRYHAPKYKIPKAHNHHTHPQNASKTQAG